MNVLSGINGTCKLGKFNKLPFSYSAIFILFYIITKYTVG